MKCDRCSSPATIHEVVISGGQRTERHLCEACAADSQIVPAAPSQLTDLLTQYLSLPDAAAAAALSIVPETPGQTSKPFKATPGRAQQPSSCPACGLTFAQFRKDEKLGCGHCYHTFLPQLIGLVQRLHDGATAHIGKVPRRLIDGRPAKTLAGQTPATAPPAALQREGAAAASAVGNKAYQAKLASEVRAQLAARLRTLQEALQQAVQCEQYERAAELRDQIRHLEALAKPQGAPAPTDLEPPTP